MIWINLLRQVIHISETGLKMMYYRVVNGLMESVIYKDCRRSKKVNYLR